jgi:acid phosphatase class B
MKIIKQQEVIFGDTNKINMIKVTHADLESVTKFLDKIVKLSKDVPLNTSGYKERQEAIKLSKMIKDKYTEIKPDYEK